MYEDEWVNKIADIICTHKHIECDDALKDAQSMYGRYKSGLSDEEETAIVMEAYYSDDLESES